MRCNKPAEAAAAVAAAGMAAGRAGEGALSIEAADDAAAAAALRAAVAAGVDVYEYSRQKVELSDLVLQALREDNQEPSASAPPPRRKG